MPSAITGSVIITDVWGFDEDAVKALKTMEPPDSDKELLRKYSALLAQESELLQDRMLSVGDNIGNRAVWVII